jgi:hypothetical protein
VNDEHPRPPVATGSLDRAALERVLSRAAELQASAADPGESMTDAQLLELGKEVGISTEFLKQALAEERTRVALPDESAQGGGFFGPSIATASRVVRGKPADLIGQIDRWMQKEELLQVKRRFTDRLTWEPRRDFFTNMSRTFNFGGRGYALRNASEVGATVVAIDDDRSLVRLDADMSSSRQRSVGWGIVTSVGGAGLGAGALALAASIPGGSIPIAGMVAGAWAVAGAGGAYGIARGQRRSVLRAQLALEQVLDRVEHGDARRSSTLLDVLASARGLRER